VMNYKQQFRIQARISKKGMDRYEARIKSSKEGQAPSAGDSTRSEEYSSMATNKSPKC
jgi:hypothetical protein